MIPGVRLGVRLHGRPLWTCRPLYPRCWLGLVSYGGNNHNKRGFDGPGFRQIVNEVYSLNFRTRRLGKVSSYTLPRRFQTKLEYWHSLIGILWTILYIQPCYLAFRYETLNPWPPTRDHHASYRSFAAPIERSSNSSEKRRASFVDIIFGEDSFISTPKLLAVWLPCKKNPYRHSREFRGVAIFGPEAGWILTVMDESG